MVSLTGLAPRAAVRQVTGCLQAAGCPDAGYDAGVLYTLATGRDARLDDAPLSPEAAERLETLTRRLARQDRFVLEGPEYKRPKEAPSPLLAPWYAKKSFSLCQEGEHCDLLWSHDLVDLLLEGFGFLLPLYQYFASLDADPAPAQG